MADRYQLPDGRIVEALPGGGYRVVSGGSPAIGPAIGGNAYAEPKAAADARGAEAGARIKEAEAAVAAARSQTELMAAQARLEQTRLEMQRDQQRMEMDQQKAAKGEKTTKDGLDVIGQAKALDLLQKRVDEIDALYQRDFKGFNLREMAPDFLPKKWRPAHADFDAASGTLMGDLKSAMAMTGGEANSPAEVEQRFGPWMPKSGDSDAEIEGKLRRLRELLGNEREKVAAKASALNLNLEVAKGDTKDERDDTVSAGLERLLREAAAGRASIADINAYAKANNFPEPTGVEQAIEFLKANPDAKIPVDAIIRTPLSATESVIGKVGDSSLGAYGVSAANMLTAGTLDEMAGGNAQQAKEMLRQEYPGASLAGDVTGAALGMTGVNAGLRFAGGRLAGLATRGGGIGGDALYGGAFGAGEDNDNRLTGAITGAGSAVAGNLVGRGLVSGVGRSVRGVQDANVGYLANRGVRMTPGQIVGQGGMFGRGLRAVEDSLESVPFLGAAIRNRKAEGLQDFDRLAFNDAVAPVNGQVNAIGQDGVGQAHDAVIGGYRNGLGGVNLRADLPFVQDASAAVRAGRQVPEFGQDVDYLARANLGPTFGPNRTLTGEGFQSSLQDINATAADFRRAANVRGRNANQSMMDLRNAYTDLAARQAPGTNEALQAANTANRHVSILEDAVMSAVNNDGIFTPAQLGRKAQMNTKKFGGKKAAARGDVPFNELQQAGQAVLPNEVPNSGTTDRALATLALPAALGGAAGGSELLNMPAPVTGSLVALGALSTRRGNQVAQSLLTSRDPAVRAVGEQILRGRRAGGMFGAGFALPATVNQ